MPNKKKRRDQCQNLVKVQGLNKHLSLKKNTFLFYYGPFFTYRTEPPDS